MVEEEMCSNNLLNVLELISQDSFIFNHGQIIVTGSNWPNIL